MFKQMFGKMDRADREWIEQDLVELSEFLAKLSYSLTNLANDIQVGLKKYPPFGYGE